jgi:hypothetical protein
VTIQVGRGDSYLRGRGLERSTAGCASHVQQPVEGDQPPGSATARVARPPRMDAPVLCCSTHSRGARPSRSDLAEGLWCQCSSFRTFNTQASILLWAARTRLSACGMRRWALCAPASLLPVAAPPSAPLHPCAAPAPPLRRPCAAPAPPLRRPCAAPAPPLRPCTAAPLHPLHPERDHAPLRV